jgi:hypothetical protein
MSHRLLDLTSAFRLDPVVPPPHPAAFGRGLPLAGGHEPARFKSAERRIHCARRHVAAGLVLDVPPEVYTVRIIAKPDDREQQEEFKFTKRLRHWITTL